MLKIQGFTVVDRQLMKEASNITARKNKFDQRAHGNGLSQFFRDIKDYNYAIKTLKNIESKENYYKTVVYEGERLSAWDSILKAREKNVLACEMETGDWLFAPQYQHVLEQAKRTVGEMAKKISEANYTRSRLFEKMKSKIFHRDIAAAGVGVTLAAIAFTLPVWGSALISIAIGQPIELKQVLEIYFASIPITFMPLSMLALGAYAYPSGWLKNLSSEKVEARYVASIEVANKLTTVPVD
ncbi:MAG: hypothetical protein NTX79_05295 [Candidatus Micrarchaeota archaeon]|nr:hypothetical protein [Candidatus Micrarchaeota archaeon]